MPRVGKFNIKRNKKREFIMEVKKTTPQYSLIAGILFGIFAVRNLIWCTQYFSFSNVLYLAVFAMLTVLFVIKKQGILTTAVLGVLALLELWNFFANFKNYTVWEWDYWRNEKFSIFVMLLYLLVALAFIALFCIAAANYTTWLDRYKQIINQLWFLPPALMLARVILGALAYILSRILSFVHHSYMYIWGSAALYMLLMAAAMLFAGLAIVFPDGLPKSNSNAAFTQTEGENQKMETNTSGVANSVTNEAYCSLVKHILLLLFTFGIWHLIWIYRMTDYTNAAQDEEPRNPTNKLLLSLFVPFYIIYWTYKTAQRVDKMAVAKGLTSDMATLCLILEIFVPIIPPILLQDKMNNIVTAGNVRPAAAPKAQKTNNDATLGTAEELKTYKELLDSGVITQEEFDAKKKQLLGL